jgi:hypothetical protein
MHIAPPLTILREADFDNGQRVVALSGTWNSVPTQLIVLSGDAVRWLFRHSTTSLESLATSAPQASESNNQSSRLETSTGQVSRL